jgi:hypothetical protein
MFLFTTPPGREAKSSQPGGGQTVATPVTKAIRDGAARTGADFDYLVRTAQRESALDPNARARTSSATGLFQFIDQTWLQMVREEGPRHGLSSFAEAIQPDGAGRLTIADPELRQQVLDLRKDPQLASVMAGAFTQKNREAFSGAIGRQPTQGELYVAHFLGARGAVELTRAAATDPSGSAAALFPDAAGANRTIFFDKAGKARSASEVYGLLTTLPQGPQQGQDTQGQLAQGQLAQGFAGAEVMAGLSPQKARGLVGLFSTEGPRGPVSDAVTRHWASPRGDIRTAALSNAPRFFPRLGATDAAPSGELPAIAPGEKPASPPEGVLVDAPMPPTRPAFDAMAVARNRSSASQKGGPLDLRRFLTARGGA